MRERVTVVTLSVTHSVFHSGEGAVCRVEVYILGHDLSALNVALF